jgi:ech hydrogenase subunit A
MEMVLFLAVFPAAVAVLLRVLPREGARALVTRGACAAVGAASIALVWLQAGSAPAYFAPGIEGFDRIMFVTEGLIAVLILYLGIRAGRILAPVLAALQFALMALLELGHLSGKAVGHELFMDRLSLVMALIIGVIGSLICVYALGYMRDFHAQHPDVKDRRPFFFFLLFIFLSAMFGLVFSNSLVWLFFFWEITTLCSFLLIGYTKTAEAETNAWRALTMNLAGGLAFAGALVFLALAGGPLELDKLIASPHGAVMLPVALLCFAGITKSAQMPFSSWLLGAMVAPTPTSALLHSSTMVKAGVYLILRLAPVVQGSLVGDLTAFVGGATFLFAAFIAISQRNAKKVLAYSTVSNLGLIVACGGVGTPGAVWAGIFLVIFHAVAKSLLFLCVGTLEHRIASRDIEDMDSVIIRMPRLMVMMLIGIAGMFIAPFGMLISKWAALRAFLHLGVAMSPILILVLAYGSAATVFFWTKWMGKIIAVNGLRKAHDTIEDDVSGDESFAHWVHAGLTILVCLAFPILSTTLVSPYLAGVYGSGAMGMEGGNLRIMALMMGIVLLLPVFAWPIQKRAGYVIGTPYMAGRDQYPLRVFEGSMAERKQATLKNYYLGGLFGEDRFMRIGVYAGACLVICMLGAAFL